MEAEGRAVGIIGLGLIGGSVALRLRQQGFADLILGFDLSGEAANEALSLGIIDEISSIDNLLHKASVIVIAIPVDATKKLLPQLLDNCKSSQVIIDMGSTKSAIARVVENHPNRSSYVACHPIAGTENNGPSAAFSTLYEGKVNIICDKELSDGKALETALEITEILGMRVKYMNSVEHDRHIAYVSHLSHISSFTLGQTVLEVEENEKNIFDMAGSGFASTVRLAKSSPEMWAPIFVENSKNILEVLKAYIANLEQYKKMIEEADNGGLFAAMKKTNRIRAVLENGTKQKSETKELID